MVAVIAIAGVAAALTLAGKPRAAAPVAVTEAMAYTATMNANSAEVTTKVAFTSGNGKYDITSTGTGPVSWSADQGEESTKTESDGRPLETSQQLFDGRRTRCTWSRRRPRR